MNKVFLLGNIGSDIEKLGMSNTDKTCVKFSLATNKTFKRNNEKVQKTTWHQVKAFSYTANFLLKYGKKGDQVLIEGEINNYQYEKDGNKKYGSEIVANRVDLLSSKNKMAETNAGKNENTNQGGFEDNSQWGGHDYSQPNDFDEYDNESFDFGPA